MVREHKLREYFKKININIDKNELNGSSLPGFDFPNDFTINNLYFLISGQKHLTNENCKEFCFAIDESGADNISKQSFFSRLYLISILFVCYRINKCWFGETFYLLFLKTIVTTDAKNLIYIEELIDILEDESDFYESFDLILKLAKLIICNRKKYECTTLINEFYEFYKKYNDLFEDNEIEEQCYEAVILSIPKEEIKDKITDILTKKI